MRVVVIGSGVAGTAAALSARAAGAEVIVVRGSSGASSLGVGAYDATPWEATRDVGPIDAVCTRLLAELGGISAPTDGALLASSTGVLRAARAYDAALLDLAKVKAGRVLVLDAPLASWEASSLARSFNATHARRTLSFEAASGTFTKHVDERAMTYAELAARHDDDARLSWLATKVREAIASLGDVAAVLFPPILGADRSRAADLTNLVGVPCGEAIAAFSSPSGRRFDAARDRALSSAHVDAIDGWCKRIVREEHLTIELEEGDAIDADAVVLAIGGLLGGGIVYEPAEGILATAVPPYPRRVFACSVDAPVTIGSEGKELLVPGSMFGLSAEQIAWPFVRDPLTERVGVLTEGERASERIFAAGDVLADRPRTWLAALASGARAGTAAAT